MRKLKIISAVLVALGAILPVVTNAADLHATPSPPSPPPANVDLRQALIEKGLLYELRAQFSVMDRSDIPAALTQDAKRLKGASFFAEERDYTLQALLAEGSYYIVSLSYLVQAGGANWPTDKSSTVYENDADVKLEALEHRWVRTAPGDDAELSSVLTSADLINAWTEGETKVSGELDHFSEVPALVDAALAATKAIDL